MLRGAALGLHICNGHFGEPTLDRLDFVYAASWPRAIRQGDGTLCIYISDRGDTAQRAAIADIAYCHAGGDGPYAIFAMRYRLEPQILTIDMHVDGKRSRLPSLAC